MGKDFFVVFYGLLLIGWMSVSFAMEDAHDLYAGYVKKNNRTGIVAPIAAADCVSAQTKAALAFLNDPSQKLVGMQMLSYAAQYPKPYPPYDFDASAQRVLSEFWAQNPALRANSSALFQAALAHGDLVARIDYAALLSSTHPDVANAWRQQAALGQALTDGHLYHLPTIYAAAQILQKNNPKRADWFQELAQSLQASMQPDNRSVSTIIPINNQPLVLATIERDQVDRKASEQQAMNTPSRPTVWAAIPEAVVSPGENPSELAAHLPASNTVQQSVSLNTRVSEQPIPQSPQAVARVSSSTAPKKSNHQQPSIRERSMPHVQAPKKSWSPKAVAAYLKNFSGTADDLNTVLPEMYPLLSAHQSLADQAAPIMFRLLAHDERSLTLLTTASNAVAQTIARDMITNPSTSAPDVITWTDRFLDRGGVLNPQLSAVILKATAGTTSIHDRVNLLQRAMSNHTSEKHLYRDRIIELLTSYPDAYDQALSDVALSVWQDAQSDDKTALAQKLVAAFAPSSLACAVELSAAGNDLVQLLNSIKNRLENNGGTQEERDLICAQLQSKHERLLKNHFKQYQHVARMVVNAYYEQKHQDTRLVAMLAQQVILPYAQEKDADIQAKLVQDADQLGIKISSKSVADDKKAQRPEDEYREAKAYYRRYGSPKQDPSDKEKLLALLEKHIPTLKTIAPDRLTRDEAFMLYIKGTMLSYEWNDDPNRNDETHSRLMAEIIPLFERAQPHVSGEDLKLCRSILDRAARDKKLVEGFALYETAKKLFDTPSHSDRYAQSKLDAAVDKLTEASNCGVRGATHELIHYYRSVKVGPDDVRVYNCGGIPRRDDTKAQALLQQLVHEGDRWAMDVLGAWKERDKQYSGAAMLYEQLLVALQEDSDGSQAARDQILTIKRKAAQLLNVSAKSLRDPREQQGRYDRVWAYLSDKNLAIYPGAVMHKATFVCEHPEYVPGRDPYEVCAELLTPILLRGNGNDRIAMETRLIQHSITPELEKRYQQSAPIARFLGFRAMNSYNAINKIELLHDAQIKFQKAVQLGDVRLIADKILVDHLINQHAKTVGDYTADVQTLLQHLQSNSNPETIKIVATCYQMLCGQKEEASDAAIENAITQVINGVEALVSQQDDPGRRILFTQLRSLYGAEFKSTEARAKMIQSMIDDSKQVLSVRERPCNTHECDAINDVVTRLAQDIPVNQKKLATIQKLISLRPELQVQMTELQGVLALESNALKMLQESIQKSLNGSRVQDIGGGHQVMLLVAPQEAA